MLPCLDAAGARSVVEVGAYAGDLTEALARWAADAGARVVAIDPAPHERLVRLAGAVTGPAAAGAGASLPDTGGDVCQLGAGGEGHPDSG